MVDEKVVLDEVESGLLTGAAAEGGRLRDQALQSAQAIWGDAMGRVLRKRGLESGASVAPIFEGGHVVALMVSRPDAPVAPAPAAPKKKGIRR